MFPPVKRVFLSSVGRGLEKHRQVVSEAIEYLDGYKCVRMEDFGARDRSSIDFCCETVRDCSIFVGILGPAYGSCPPSSRRSFSELEYDAAVDAGIPRLIFLTPARFRGAKCPVEHEWKQRKQRSFRRRVTSERQARYFRSSMDLAIHVVVALYNHERSQESKEPGRSLAPENHSHEKRPEATSIKEN